MTPERASYIDELFAQIQAEVKKLWCEEATADVFGSARNGTALFTSDYDIAITF